MTERKFIPPVKSPRERADTDFTPLEPSDTLVKATEAIKGFRAQHGHEKNVLNGRRQKALPTNTKGARWAKYCVVCAPDGSSRQECIDAIPCALTGRIDNWIEIFEDDEFSPGTRNMWESWQNMEYITPGATLYDTGVGGPEFEKRNPHE